MKRIRIYSVVLVGMIAMLNTSCKDWLQEPSPGVTKLEDFFTSGATADQTVVAAYVPLMWEFNSTYFSEWFIGDVMSDDALKGGQNIGDMADVYDMENWKTNTNSSFLLDYYRAQYQGVGRCNLALTNIPGMELDDYLKARATDSITAGATTNVKERLIGEAYFLRAYYYFRLVRVFGSLPKVDFVIESSEKWNQPAATVDALFDFIIADLKNAESPLWSKSVYEQAAYQNQMGRATKEAAWAMLQKVYLYMASPYWQEKRGKTDKAECLAEAKQWGAKVINVAATKGLFALTDYSKLFTLAEENGRESVFEIQYMAEQTSDYGEGFGFTRGTFSSILTRSRAKKYGEGWGFNHPTQNLYDEFETNDTRRDYSIFNPKTFDNETEERYLGSPYLNRKLMFIAYYDYDKDSIAYTGLDHATRGPLNNKQIRYADVLLMQAEICAESGDVAGATTYLNEVRSSRSMATYPGYTFTTTTPSTGDALIDAIRHERRMELAMEGHRWFDIVRWGNAKETMDAYKKTESEEAVKHMSEFVKGKHELLPLPSKEIDLQPDLKSEPWYN